MHKKFGKDHVCGSGDILSDRQTDTQYFATALVGEVMTQADRNGLEAMKMWIWRRMEKISWMDKISNEKVLQRVNEAKTMLDTVRKCKRVVMACAKT